MSVIEDLRKNVDTTPFFAAVGATDLAVEKVREARVRAAAMRTELEIDTLQSRAAKVAGEAQHLPILALNKTLELAGKAQESYDELADRGQKLVTRIRNQKATQDLLAQAGNTVALGKGAVTTLRKAAVDTERAAMATLTTGRHQAEEAAGTVAGSAKAEARTSGRAVKKAAAGTKPAAKRTATTARKRGASAKRATKAAATSAAKTAEAAEKATTTAAEKVGD